MGYNYNPSYSSSSSIDTILIITIIATVIATVIALIINILICIASVKLAKKKGRSVEVWFALTFLFGIVSIIVLYYLPDYLPEQNDYTSRKSYLLAKKEITSRNVESNTWFCQCGARNKNLNTVCSICGNPKPNIKPNIEPTNTPLQSSKWKCTTCGYENNPKATMCINCGKVKE